MNASNPTPALRTTPMTVVALLLLVAVAGGVGWMLGHRAPATASLDAMPVDAGQANGASAPAGAASLGTMPAGMTPSMAGQPSPGAHPASAALLGMSKLNLAELKQKQAQKQRQLENNFASDAQDPNAAQVELGMLKAMVDPALMNDGLAPGNPEVKCHRDSCRISADFNSADDASSWAVNYVTMLGGKLGTSQPVFLPRPDGSVRMQLYGTRR